MFYPHHTSVASRMRVLHPSNPYYNTLSQYVDPPVNPNPSSDSNASPASPSPPQRSQSYTPTTSANQSQPQQRPREAAKIRTRSVGGPFGVIFEREIDLSPPNDDEIIIATVRLTNNFRRASVSGSSDLPERPQKRSFLRRMSTRFSGPYDGNKYTAIKLPRRDYKKWFARDKDGKYVGTEEEREWTMEELEERFGLYQDMPLRSIPGGSEYGEGDVNQPKQDALLRTGNEDGWFEEQMVVDNDGSVRGLRRVDGRYLL